MKKHLIISNLLKHKIVAIVRAKSADNAIEAVKACVDGGVKVVEISFTVPDAERVIREAGEEYREKIMIGAGTVLNAEATGIACRAGACFIVSPCFSEKVANICNSVQIPYIPGCMTPTEMFRAMEHGSEIIKLFPASEFTPGIIKAIKGPLPQVTLMPTGGITLDNIGEWFDAGCEVAGVGGALTRVLNGDYDGITRRCRELLSKIG